MNLFKKALVALALGLPCISNSVYAQYQFQVDPLFSYFKDPGRYELGGTFILPTGTFSGVTPVYDNGTFRGDSAASRALPGTPGFGVSIGLSLPFKATGHISCWAVAFQVMANQYMWENLNQTLDLAGTYTNHPTSLNATTLNVQMPIGIDYKAGHDAILTKRLPFTTSLGVGVIPQVNITSLEGVTDVASKMSFGATPYAKVEVGVFLGISVKVRAMYTMGTITMIDVPTAIPSLTDGPFKVNSNSNLMISLILMPFSGGWRETNWWNTHDTYNQHDRLN